MILYLIKRHLKSAGFQKRLKHIYLPTLKKGIAYLWNVYADKKERKVFDEVYRKSETVLPYSKTEILSAPMGYSMPLYENIADRLKKWFTESPYQGSTGQCVAFTLDNIVRASVKLAGLGDIAVSPLDVYLDRTTRKKKGDYTGMNVELMFKSVARKGVAVAELLPRMDDQSKMVEVDDRNMYPDNLLDPLRVKIVTGADQIGQDWRNLINTINSLPTGYPVQVSMGVGDGYFGYDIPKEKSNVMYGGHSVCAIGGSGCIVDGKEGFFINDSAFFKGRVTRFGLTIRFITKEFWTKNGWGAMLPRFVEPLEKKILENKPYVPVEYITLPANQGEEGDHVRAIQNALIRLGHNITSGATGFYGTETAKAVLSFQVSNAQKFFKLNNTYTSEALRSFGGKYFGTLSVKVINMVLEDK